MDLKRVKSCPKLKEIDEANFNLLNALLTKDKVQTTLFQMASLKAPGLEGLHAHFFSNTIEYHR